MAIEIERLDAIVRDAIGSHVGGLGNLSAERLARTLVPQFADADEVLQVIAPDSLERIGLLIIRGRRVELCTVRDDGATVKDFGTLHRPSLTVEYATDQATGIRHESWTLAGDDRLPQGGIRVGTEFLDQAGAHRVHEALKRLIS